MYERGELEGICFYWDDAREELTIREIRSFRTQPVCMIIRMEQYETIIRYDGGEKRLSLRE